MNKKVLLITIVVLAAVGAIAKIGIKQSDGTKALIITKKTADTIVIMYQG